MGFDCVVCCFNCGNVQITLAFFVARVSVSFLRVQVGITSAFWHQGFEWLFPFALC